MKPEYFADAFPFDNFPQYVWETKPTLPQDVWTTETTHRDGQQGGLPLSVETGIKLFELMNEFSGQSGAIRQAEFFVYRPADKAMLEAAIELYQSGAPIEPTTWIRASVKDVELIKKLGIKETGMLASASDFHTFHKFSPGGREQATKIYLEAVQMVLDAGIRPRLHLEDATRAPREFILPFVEAVLKMCEPYGVRPKFRLCDTMGVGLPFENVQWPRSIPRMVKEVLALGVNSTELEFHPHNDTYLVVANCLAAIMAGCSAINGTLLGKGERTGNAPLEGVIFHLIGMGYFENQPVFKVLNQISELYSQLGESIPNKYPLFGRDAHRTRAGIHADGLNKSAWMYAFCDTQKLLGRPLEVSLTKESGLAGIIFLIKQHLGIELHKDDLNLLKIADWLQKEFDSGRVTAVEWEELVQHLPKAMLDLAYTK